MSWNGYIVETKLPTTYDNDGRWEYGYERDVYCPNEDCERDYPLYTMYRGGRDYTYVEDTATCRDCGVNVRIEVYQNV